MNVTEKCGRGQFLCAKNTCVHPKMICNGIKDCEDGSDEIHCGKNGKLNFFFFSISCSLRNYCVLI